jgi:hypothetical protein
MACHRSQAAFKRTRALNSHMLGGPCCAAIHSADLLRPPCFRKPPARRLVPARCPHPLGLDAARLPACLRGATGRGVLRLALGGVLA